MSETDPKKSNLETSGKPDFKLMPIALDIGFTIALPLVFLALGGRLLDKYLDSSPLFILTGMALAITISIIILIKKVKQLF